MRFVVEKVREDFLADGKYSNEDEQGQQKSRKGYGGNRRPSLFTQPLIDGLAAFAVNTIWTEFFCGHSFNTQSCKPKSPL
jgi:hypothetical protein